MPTQAKRVIVSTAILASAVILHSSFCRWSFGGNRGPDALAYVRPYSNANEVGYEYYGFVGRSNALPGSLASVGGVLLPTNLLLLQCYLWAHWRESRRHAAGRCLACAHLLAGAITCPECGTAQRAA